jgi:hypothetical protein
VRYCREGGVEVAAIVTPGGGEEPDGLEAELRATLDTGRVAAKAAPDAGAIAVPGRAMALHVVPVLEKEFNKPVLTMLTCDVWETLVHPGVIPPIRGWGTLLATP